MVLPSGSEQALSLAWALENVADYEKDAALSAACALMGIPEDDWERCVADRSWFVGDPRWNGREKIERRWNERFAHRTKVRLDEDVWHTPLWQQWLTTPKMVLAANLSHLMQIRGRGATAELARATKRNPSTISRWGNWQEKGPKVRVPPSTAVAKILDFFGLPASIDLTREPLFLGRDDVRDALYRQEGKHYLDCLSGEHLRQAVDKLREESARQAERSRHNAS